MAAEDSAGKMRERAALCEHPFGTMKRWLGWDHFLVRGFKKVRGEMALLVNCYNLRRVMTILGVRGFVAYCEARKLRLEAEGECHAFCAVQRPIQAPAETHQPFFSYS